LRKKFYIFVNFSYIPKFRILECDTQPLLAEEGGHQPKKN
jgi:hypothetical protein